MPNAKLTKPVLRGHKLPMKRVNFGARHAGAALVLLGTIPVAGCISLETPDKPIVIELNINITQEVIYRLSADAGNAIEENADIF